SFMRREADVLSDRDHTERGQLVNKRTDFAANRNMDFRLRGAMPRLGRKPRVREPENVFVPFQSCLVHGISSRQPESTRITRTDRRMARNGDLFGNAARKKPLARPGRMAPQKGGLSNYETPGDLDYTAASIEVLEGLEPVRRRPGMFIGGTGEAALHHLFAEVLDNAMDEAVAGHASFIDVRYEASGFLCVCDNGRGFPVDSHKKFPKKSALEVVMTMLHAGGKFDQKSYQTSGGLHGVGISVVN